MPVDAASDGCGRDGGIEQSLAGLSLGPTEQQQQQQGDVDGSAAGRESSGNGDSVAASTPAAAAKRNRKLPHVSSRGSGLGAGSGGSGGGSSAPDVGSLPEVDVDDPCHWLGFSGDWGGDGPPGPAFQSWYHRAECPVSRSPLLRVVGHFVHEPDRL